MYLTVYNHSAMATTKADQQEGNPCKNAGGKGRRDYKEGG